MSALRTADPDVFLLGVEHGRRDSAALAVARLMEAEEHERHLLELVKQLRAENSRLRRLTGSPVSALRWASVASFLTFLATYNVLVNGWSL